MLAGPCFAVHLDEVADFKGPERQEHDAGGEVAERSLEGHTHREASSRQHGGEARRLNPEHPEASENRTDEEQVATELREEPGQRRIEVALLEPCAHCTFSPVGDDPSDEERPLPSGHARSTHRDSYLDPRPS